MIFELEIKDGKEKLVINFLKQLDFVTIKAVKAPKKKGENKSSKTGDLSYFGTLPEWEMDIQEIRKKDTSKRTKGWL